MSGKPFRSIEYCPITKSSVDVIRPYIDSDKDVNFRLYGGLNTGVDIAADSYIYAALFGSVIDVSDYDNRTKIVTLQYDSDQIIRYANLSEVYVDVNYEVNPWEAVGWSNNYIHVEYGTAWKKNARWSIKLLRNVWYKQDPMSFVEGTMSSINESSDSRSISYSCPSTLNDANKKEKVSFIQTISTSVIKYAYSYGICVYSPIVAQAIVESEWGKSSNLNYFLCLKNDKVYPTIDQKVEAYFRFISNKYYSNVKDLKDPYAYIDSIAYNGYYPVGTSYTDTIKSVMNEWNLTQIDGQSTNLSVTANMNKVDYRNHLAYVKDTNSAHFGEIYDNK